MYGTLIETITVGSSGVASMDFVNIPQTPYTDLYLVISARDTNASAGWDEIQIKFNGVSTNQTRKTLYGTGSGSAGTDTGSAFYAYTNPNGNTANTFSSNQITIPNYAGSTNKSIGVEAVTEQNATTVLLYLEAGLWSSTAAINQITLTAANGTFMQYSSASLYGIAKGSGGATVS